MEWRGSMLPHFEMKGGESILVSQTSESKTALRSVPTHWSQFRGPERDGIAPSQGIELNWSASPVLRWKVPAGEGHSSIITFGQSVITMEQDGPDELIVATSLDDGKTLWKYAENTLGRTWRSRSATPTLSDGKLYALFSDGSLFVWKRVPANLCGKPKPWVKSMNSRNGTLLLASGLERLVIVTPGGEEGGSSLSNRIRKAGLEVRLPRRAFTCLLPADSSGHRQLITAVSGKVASLDRVRETL